MNGKERCLRVIAGAAPDRVPVFPLLMFFSARQLGVNYRSFASDGTTLAEAQLCISGRFPIDALTVCSDAYRVTADLGGEVVFPEDQTPHAISNLVAREADLDSLSPPDPLRKGSRMRDRIDAIEHLVRSAGDELLILGWVDMPFAEACSVCGVSEFMMMIMLEPDLAHRVLRFLTDIVISFALRQLEAGAPMIGAGDAAASLISPDLFREFALPYEQEVIRAIHEKGGLAKLHICGNTSHLVEDMVQSDADLFNIDHQVDLEIALEVYGRHGKAAKGNLDPSGDMLLATPEECLARSLQCIRTATGRDYMLSGGCEAPPDVSDEVFEAFCRAPDDAP